MHQGENDEPNITALDCALWLFGRIEADASLSIYDLADFDYLDLLIELHPAITSIQPSENNIYYQIQPELAQHYAIMCHGSTDLVALIRRICIANILNGQPVPHPFRGMCSAWMHGSAVGAKAPGPKRGQRFGLFFVAREAAKYLVDAYNLDFSRGDDKLGSAADVVAEALIIKGVECKYTTVRDWLQHEKHSENRNKAELLSCILRENSLAALGMLNAGRFPISGLPPPYGRIHGIGRMTQQRITGKSRSIIPPRGA